MPTEIGSEPTKRVKVSILETLFLLGVDSQGRRLKDQSVAFVLWIRVHGEFDGVGAVLPARAIRAIRAINCQVYGEKKAKITEHRERAGRLTRLRI